MTGHESPAVRLVDVEAWDLGSMSRVSSRDVDSALLEVATGSHWTRRLPTWACGVVAAASAAAASASSGIEGLLVLWESGEALPVQPRIDLAESDSCAGPSRGLEGVGGMELHDPRAMARPQSSMNAALRRNAS
eukprot:scaffold7360_cov270-Pinguiococcus_pyrenoidosus.AAC.6